MRRVPPPLPFYEILYILLQLSNRCGTITVLKSVNIKSFGSALFLCELILLYLYQREVRHRRILFFLYIFGKGENIKGIYRLKQSLGYSLRAALAVALIFLSAKRRKYD